MTDLHRASRERAAQFVTWMDLKSLQVIFVEGAVQVPGGNSPKKSFGWTGGEVLEGG